MYFLLIPTEFNVSCLKLIVLPTNFNTTVFTIIFYSCNNNILTWNRKFLASQNDGAEFRINMAFIPENNFIKHCITTAVRLLKQLEVSFPASGFGFDPSSDRV